MRRPFSSRRTPRLASTPVRCTAFLARARIRAKFSQSLLAFFGPPTSLDRYFANVSTVILNKWIFAVYGFKFPMLLTAIHMLLNTIGAAIVLHREVVPMQRLDRRYYWTRIVPLSAVFCVNIVLGNVSLRWVPVSFMQTIKSSVPACTVLLQAMIGTRVSFQEYLSIVPIVGGVMLATLTELSFDATGFWAAVVASFVTAAMAILTSRVLTQKLDPFNLLYAMAPPSVVMLLPPILLFEADGLVAWSGSSLATGGVFVVLLLSGLIAFALNATSFFVIQATSPLTFTVAGNFKVVISVALSIMIFRNPFSTMNAVGCAVALLGVAYYNQVRSIGIGVRDRDQGVVVLLHFVGFSFACACSFARFLLTRFSSLFGLRS